MRLITYQSTEGLRVGVLNNKRVRPVPGMDMLELIRQGEAGIAKARASGEIELALSSLTLLAPIPEPRRNIICLGMNYAAHAAESLRAKSLPIKMPDVPVFFTKATTTVNAPFGDIPYDPGVTEKLDWEVELAVVIGKQGKNISREEAFDIIFGYTVLNDVSARDLQVGHQQFFKGKSLDGTCPMGPAIVTKDEIPDPHNLILRCWVNGELKQESTTGDLIFDIPALIEWLSRGMTLLPGDILSTGTPSGVGFARTPPEFLKPGDVVACEVEGIGRISNRVVLAEG
jgi:2-keto-4-pentenoate hydratase/2-oxohepta-3-ene-1,7-dioic acid hydratase in catechol pathway